MAENPTTEGPVKSLRQAAPAGDIVAGVFAAIAALIVIGLFRAPASAGSLLVSLLFIAMFAGPAYVLYASSRSTGIFVSDDRVEYRLLGRVQASWKKEDVGALEPLSGGLRLVGPDGRLLRHFKFRWWSTEQATRFARSAGLLPGGVQPSPVSEAMARAAAEARAEREAAGSGPEANPGKPGDS